MSHNSGQPDFTYLSEFQHGFEVWSGKSHASSFYISRKSYNRGFFFIFSELPILLSCTFSREALFKKYCTVMESLKVSRECKT